MTFTVAKTARYDWRITAGVWLACWSLGIAVGRIDDLAMDYGVGLWLGPFIFMAGVYERVEPVHANAAPTETPEAVAPSGTDACRPAGRAELTGRAL